MKKTFHTLAVTAVAFVLSIPALCAAETNSTPPDVEAKYTAAIEGRTADILKILALSDTNKTVKVHDLLIAQYRALKRKLWTYSLILGQK